MKMYYNNSLPVINFNRTLVFFALVLLTAGCNERHLPDFLKFKNQQADEGEALVPVARVYDNYLYEKDLEGIVDKGASSSDSASLVSRYIDSWIRKQVMIAEASSKIDFDEAELERKILDYRYALMVYEFEKNYVNQEADTEVSQEEIATYYKHNKANFELKQNIIKGIFAKVPQEAPRIGRLRTLFQGKLDKEAQEEIKSYCLSFATSYSLDDSVWYNFEDVIKNTPLVSIPNKVQFLRENKFVETSDDIYVYFLRIRDYKISDQISPLEFVTDDIVKVIRNKRKVSLARKLEEDIYNDARKKKEFEIFTTQSIRQDVTENNTSVKEDNQ